MKRKPIYKAIIAIAVAMAFVMPVAAVANVGTIGVTSNSENTSDIENTVEISTNSDTSDIRNNNLIPEMFDNDIVYVDDDKPSWWYDETHVKTINEGITNVSVGGEVCVYNGIYTEHVTVDKQVNLIGESRDNVIVDGSGSGYIVYVTVDGVTIDTFSITNGAYGIYIWKYSNNNIKNCDVYNNTGNGISLSASSNNVITNCDAYNNTRSGIYLSDATNNVITNCNLYNNKNTGISLYRPSNNNVITNCNVYNNVGNAGIYFNSAPNNNITSCNSYNNIGMGISVLRSSYNNFMNCNVYNNKYNNIYLYLSPNCNITNCNVHDLSYGIYLNKVQNCVVTNCNAYDNTNTGIGLSESSNNTIIDCIVHNNGKYGISLYKSSNNNVITNCNSYNNTKGGIYFDASSYNNIAECEAYNNTDLGICLYTSPNNFITNSKVYNNTKEGIFLYFSSNNSITNCNVCNNTINGICIQMVSNDNSIHHNNFVNNNVVNAYDECTNQWDDGSEGNYWSDYTGVDEDGNGIGDTPYNITGKTPPNQDRCPLMSPVGDKVPPVITAVQAIPAVQSTTDPVNITCTVTDNLDLVDTVKVNISGPGGFTLEVIMNSGYWYNRVYTTMGVYFYHIWANDTSKNIAVSDTYSFVITDITTPISAVEPLPTWTKTVPFTVTATAYDPTFSPGLENVTLWYRYSSDGTDWTDNTSYGIDEEEPWSWSFTGNDGYYEFYSIAVDDVGNEEDPPDIADASTGIDTAKPVTTIEFSGTMGGDGWYTSSVTATLSATDELSGVDSTWYKLDTGIWTVYTAPFTVSSDGQHTVECYSVDNAGNKEDTKFMDFKIDKTSPITEHEFDGVIGDEGWFVSNVTVTFSVKDVFSGVNYTKYKLDEGEWTTYVDLFVVTENGTYVLYYYSVDLAGNTETTKQVTFKIEKDTEPPVTTHEFEGNMGDNDWFTSDVVVTLFAEDDSAGVDYTMYMLEDDTEWQIYTGPILVTEDGEHTIEYYSVDKVGNEEDPCDPVEFKSDQTPPTITLTAEKTGLTKWLLTADVTDATSGVAKVEFYLDGKLLGEVTTSPYEWEVSEKGMAQAFVYDNAGNKAISDEVPVSVSQSQSSSSTPVPLQILSWLFGLW